ncbi:MAG TPA: phage tail protein [Bryobacteraceae bacterium]|nr:phage tail protein [Bryobacteraceae bacterium]
MSTLPSALTAKEQLNADTPLFFFDCTLSDGTVRHWSTRTITWNRVPYEGRVVRQNQFDAQLASDTQVGGPPKLTFELANADSELSEIEQQTGFKGAELVVQSVFFNLATGSPTTDSAVVFRGLMNPPDAITETTCRLSAMNRISMQRTVIPNVRVERMCPWRFPTTAAQRLEAVDGGAARGKYSLFYRCGYSPDQANGVGNLNGSDPFVTCSYSRSDCIQRGMFGMDSSGRATARFGGLEFVPPTILVRGTGQKSSQLSAVQENTASYNDFVPLVYGTQWTTPYVVFSRNDGNLTRMEVLLGMGEIQGILTVLVNDIQIPQGVSGKNMTSTGWYNLITPGTRDGAQDGNFTDGHGVAQGDPYGSIAYLSVVVPNRINDGTSIPAVQVLMQGLKLWQFDTNGDFLGEQFSSNPAWVLMDILMRCGYTLPEIDCVSFATAAACADELISVDDPVGGQVQLPRFQCNFAINLSQSAGQIIRSIRNGSRIYVVLNSQGLLEARGENTFALQQPALPMGSNAVNPFNGGWPAYEFDASSIARNNDGSASFKLWKLGAQDTPNRLSVEFQDSYNQYQQDSLSLADEDDIDLCGQEVAVMWDAVGISTFNQASRMLLLALNKSISGNAYVEFQTSIKALGLLPGDLITVTYPKENLERTAFRIVKLTPGNSFRTATITAQFHDDDWYSDAPTGITGGLGRQSGQGSGLPAPVTGTILDANGNLELGITEQEITGSDGSAVVELNVSFVGPSGLMGTLPAPLLGLVPVVSTTGGTLEGAENYYYGVSTLDSAAGESSLSFIAQATTAVGANTNSVVLDGIQLPVGGASFNVYRGSNPESLSRIASNQTSAPSFTDTGLPPLAILPPDPQFDHVDVNWRWELLPETSATIYSAATVGNPTLQLIVNKYQSGVVRITRGRGAGQEATIAGNTPTTLTLATPWVTEPDATSFFVVAESTWRAGASGKTSPIAISVPERIGAALHVSARAANASDEQAAYALSPLTRWVLGQSGAIVADSDVPPAPSFGLVVSPVQGGVLELGEIAFPSLTNTVSIVAGTYKFHYYDEVNGAAPVTVSSPVTAGDSSIHFGSVFTSGALVQIDQEIVQVTALNADGSQAVVRGIQGTTVAAHNASALAYALSDTVLIVPFIRNFFGSPASGDWQHNLSLPNVRLASVELYMTNALGDGAVTANSYTATIDSGLRTMAGGQYSFQISGYLAVQTSAAPAVIVDAKRSVRDIYGIVCTPSAGAPIVLQVNRNGAAYASVQFDAGATQSTIAGGFGLPALQPGDQLTLDIDSVGTTIPGANLNLIMRL